MSAQRTGRETGPPEIYEAVSTAVWADGTPGKAINTQPIKIKLKEGAIRPHQK